MAVQSLSFCHVAFCSQCLNRAYYYVFILNTDDAVENDVTVTKYFYVEKKILRSNNRNRSMVMAPHYRMTSVHTDRRHMRSVVHRCMLAAGSADKDSGTATAVSLFAYLALVAELVDLDQSLVAFRSRLKTHLFAMV